ncbi:MAG: DNRLRE domain-containing protein [Phycisphaerae bacterium]
MNARAARGFLLVTLLVLACTPGTPAAVVELAASRDNTLYEDPGGSTSNGVGEYLFTGMTARRSIRRALICFDVAAAVPAGATITGAILRLHMSRTNTASEPVALHRVLADWGEGESDAFGEEGAGTGAADGDATWLHSFYEASLWQTPGGDFDPTPSAAIGVVGNGFYIWGVGGELVADVQNWLGAPAGNFGWLLRGGEEFDTTAKRFDSREHSDPSVRPVLFVEYTPVPEGRAGALLFVLVGAARGMRR